MDLIERYLVAVRRHLPPALQKDIVEELADSLRSEAEERARQAGRPLTDGDQADLLRKHGHPWLMASRYLPQQQLIGPALFPYYRQTLVMVVFWLVLPATLIGGALAAIYAQDSGQMWGRALGAAWNGAIYSVGIITLVFAFLEGQHVRLTALDNWEPARLRQPQDGREVPRSETVFNLVITISFLMLWIDYVRLPSFGDYGGEPVRFVPDPVWASVYLPVLINVLVSIAGSFVDLVRPWRTRLFSTILIANNLFALALLVILWRAGHWVTVATAAAAAEQAARADRWINLSIELSLLFIGGIILFETVRESMHVLKSRQEARA